MFAKRTIIAIAAAIAAVTLAHAQSYPAKVVKIVSPFVPGGPGDLLPRAIAAGLTPLLGRQVIVENRPGAATIIAMQAVAKAPPDGYTLIFTSVSSFINVSAYKSLPYDPIGDFAPIALCFTTPLYLVVHPSLPATSVAELIALAKSRPGKLSFASGGSGTTAHLAGELFKSLAGVDMQHVAYKSAGPAMMDVMAGHVDLMFGSAGLYEARAGKVRALAVTSAARSRVLPDVPTLSEAGFPNLENDTPQGILAPAGTPRPIIDLLYREIARIMAAPAVRARMLAIGFEPVVTTPEDFAARIRSEIPRWGKIIREANIRPE